MVQRHLQPRIESWLFRGKVIILYGARQVGKTTLARRILAAFGEAGGYYNCEVQSVVAVLSKEEPVVLKKFIGEKRIVVFDEAQHIPNVGRILKLLVDTYPDLQVIATGSSSFSLARQTSEALTGRAIQFVLYPFSYAELSGLYDSFQRLAQLETYLIYGLYPDIVQASEADGRVLLDELSTRYLYQDVLEFENIKRSDIIFRLLQLLALQIGSEVSLNELANTLQTNRRTVERYIDLLEQAFVIFRLRSFSRNLRREISKGFKVYFYDLGVRNSIVQQYQPLDLRTDKGAVWENFLIMERIKHLQQLQIRPNLYFWRTHRKEEIDFIEEYNGQLTGYEFKWKAQPGRRPTSFLESYPGSALHTINRSNFEGFVGE
jgi:uncharacterized protein